MNGAFYVGAIGLRAQERALDIVSNNIANVNTPAFKRTDVRFSAMLAARNDPEAPVSSPDDALAAAGVMASAAPALDEAGELQSTGHAMDIAIRGRGFIELMGADGQTMLWRGGTLKVGEDGMLAAADSGLALKAAITVPADATALTIDADGTVRATTSTDTDPVEIGKIGLVVADDTSGLSAVDGGLYRTDDETRLKDAVAGEDGSGALVQGSIERSNVDMSSEMIELLMVQRAYAANAQIVQAADQLMSIANGLRR